MELLLHSPTCLHGHIMLKTTTDWRRLHNEELYDLYSPKYYSGYQIKMRWAGQVARMGDRRRAHVALVGRPDGKRPLGRPRRRWEDNIKTDLQKVGWKCKNWIDLAQDSDRWRALVNAVINLRVSQNAGYFLTS